MFLVRIFLVTIKRFYRFGKKIICFEDVSNIHNSGDGLGQPVAGHELSVPHIEVDPAVGRAFLEYLDRPSHDWPGSLAARPL